MFLHKILKLLTISLATIAAAAATPSAAQQVVGQCNDLSRGQSFVFYSNYYAHQIGNPGNGGFTRRDPSFMTFLQLPAVNPMINAYFIGWDGSLIEITRGLGWQVIGGCQFNSNFVQQNPFSTVYSPPALASNIIVQTPVGERPLPQAFATQFNERPYGVPMITTEQRAIQCYQSSAGNRRAFGDCMVKAMAGTRERAVYECAQQGADEQALAFCMVGALGGSKERQIAQTLSACQQQFGNDYSQYPLCLASANVDQDTGRLLQCVQQQSSRGDVSVLGTAMCYGAGRLDMNTETQIAVQCAVTTGGEPMAFAGCAGGQLTAMELNKCFTQGVGGSGCFGPNNTIVQAFQSAGTALGQQFGPNNDLVRNWNNAVNDLRYGPGPNNDVVKVFRNVGNEMRNAPQNVADAVSRVVPKIRIKW
ncbi:hypothetical protein [Erythrobacter colymbi]|uniref:hypothetical protein n=1 Tax=Erythrobacter colymbi TaxID=1161202 RepID=UPI00117DD5D2|nr:hypothetical protein [Erythrobacter colymbi]